MKLAPLLFSKAFRQARKTRARPPPQSRYVPNACQSPVKPSACRVLLSAELMHPVRGRAAHEVLRRLNTTDDAVCRSLSSNCRPMLRAQAGQAWPGVADTVLSLVATYRAGQTRSRVSQGSCPC